MMFYSGLDSAHREAGSIGLATSEDGAPGRRPTRRSSNPGCAADRRPGDAPAAGDRAAGPAGHGLRGLRRRARFPGECRLRRQRRRWGDVGAARWPARRSTRSGSRTASGCTRRGVPAWRPARAPRRVVVDDGTDVWLADAPLSGVTLRQSRSSRAARASSAGRRGRGARSRPSPPARTGRTSGRPAARARLEDRVVAEAAGSRAARRRSGRGSCRAGSIRRSPPGAPGSGTRGRARRRSARRAPRRAGPSSSREQLRVVLGVRRVRAGVAPGPDAGAAAERVDLDARSRRRAPAGPSRAPRSAP